MYFGETIYNEAIQLEMAKADREAIASWRFRNLRTKESKLLTAVLTNVLKIFTW